MLSAITDGIQLIVNFLSSLVGFAVSLFSGLANLLKMLPQTVESVSLFALIFPAWAWGVIFGIFGLVVSLATLKWLKGLV